MKPKWFLENNLTICANLILLGILRSKSASLEDWNSHVKPLSPTHTRPVCLPGSKSPRKPMNQVTAFLIKSNSRDRIRPQMQISPDTFPFLPRTPLTSSLHCISLSLFLVLHLQEEKGRKKRMTAYLTSTREKRLTSRKKPSFYTHNTYTLTQDIQMYSK